MAVCTDTALVAEDQEFVLAGLSSLLKRKLRYSRVDQVKTYPDLLACLAVWQPTLVIVSTTLPGFSNVHSISELRKAYPTVLVVALGSSGNREAILMALASGAHGFLQRDLHPDDMAAALHFVGAGHIYVPSFLASRDEIATALPQPLATDVIKGLTGREREIVELLSLGMSNKEIARKLDISPSTVRVHVHSAFRTLGVHNRRSAAAAFMAQRPTPEKPATLASDDMTNDPRHFRRSRPARVMGRQRSRLRTGVQGPAAAG